MVDYLSTLKRDRIRNKLNKRIWKNLNDFDNI
jgi:hypothetical protein